MRAYSSLPVMIGSLVECPECSASVARWRQDSHREWHEDLDRLAAQVASLARLVASGERLAVVSPAAADTGPRS